MTHGAMHMHAHTRMRTHEHERGEYDRLCVPHCGCGRVGHALEDRVRDSEYYQERVRAQEAEQDAEDGAPFIDYQSFPCPESSVGAPVQDRACYKGALWDARAHARVFEQHQSYEPDFCVWSAPLYAKPRAYHRDESRIRARILAMDRQLQHACEHLQRLFPEHLLRDADLFDVWPRQPLTQAQVRDTWLEGGTLVFPCLSLTNDVTLDKFDASHYHWIYDARKSDVLDASERALRSECALRMVMNASCLGLVRRENVRERSETQCADDLFYVCRLKGGMYASVPQELVNRVLVEAVYRACVRDEPLPLKTDEPRYSACVRDLVRAVGRTCMTRTSKDVHIEIPYLPTWILAHDTSACAEDTDAQACLPAASAPPTGDQWDRAHALVRATHPGLAEAREKHVSAQKTRTKDAGTGARPAFARAHASKNTSMSKDKQQRTLMDVGAKALQRPSQQEYEEMGRKQCEAHRAELKTLKERLEHEKNRDVVQDLRLKMRDVESRIAAYSDDPAHAYETYHPRDLNGAISKSGAFKERTKTKKRQVVLDDDELQELSTAETIGHGPIDLLANAADSDEDDASSQDDNPAQSSYLALLGEQRIVMQQKQEAEQKLKDIRKWLDRHQPDHKTWDAQKAREQKYDKLKRKYARELNRLQEAAVIAQAEAHERDESESSDGEVSDLLDSDEDDESEEDAEYDYEKDALGRDSDDDDDVRALSDSDILEDAPVPKSKPASKSKKPEPVKKLGNPKAKASKASKPVKDVIAWNDEYSVVVEPAAAEAAAEAAPEPVAVVEATPEPVAEQAPMEVEEPSAPPAFVDFLDEPIDVVAPADVVVEANNGFAGAWPAKSTGKKDAAQKKDKKARSSESKPKKDKKKKKEEKEAPAPEDSQSESAPMEVSENGAPAKKKRVPVDPATLTPEERARRERKSEQSRLRRQELKRLKEQAAATAAQDHDDSEAAAKTSKKGSAARKRKLDDDSDLSDATPTEPGKQQRVDEPAAEAPKPKSTKKSSSSKSKKPAKEPKSIFSADSLPEHCAQWTKLFESMVATILQGSRKRDELLVEDQAYIDKCKAQSTIEGCYNANKGTIKFLDALDADEAAQTYSAMAEWYGNEFYGEGFITAWSAPKETPAARWFVVAWYMTNGAQQYPKCVARNPVFGITRPDPVVHVAPLEDINADELDDFLV